MSMTLFDEIPRTDTGPALYTEPGFHYINRTDRDEFAIIRQCLEDWFSRYPDDAKSEFRSKFRTNNDWQFQSAFFELFIHEMLLKLKCKLEIHPSLPNTSRSPDFLVETKEGQYFYMECVVATAKSREQSAIRSRLYSIYDYLNKTINSRDFFLGIKIHGYPKKSPKVKGFASYINKELNGLNVGEISQLLKEKKDNLIPSWHFKFDGGEIIVNPIPKSPDIRGKSGIRPIGMIFSDFETVDDKTPIRNAICSKAGYYGKLGLPYVIAVNAMSHPDQIDIIEAFIGSEKHVLEYSEKNPADNSKISSVRIPDGVWIRENGTVNTRVSAVLLFLQLTETNLSGSKMRLFHNPWASNPCPFVMEEIPHARLRNDPFDYIEGKSINRIMNLPDRWPFNR